MKPSANHLPSFFSSILFILAGLLVLGVALLMGVTALAALLTGAKVQPQQTIFLAAFGFVAFLLFVAAFFALQKYLGKPGADAQVSLSPSPGQISLLAGIAGLSMLAGYLVGKGTIASWVVLPLLTVPAIALPLVVLLGLGTRGLPFGSRWQAWSVLGLAMTIGPFLLFTLEIGLAILGAAGVVAYILTRPGLVAELQALAERLIVLGPQSEQALELIAPLMTEPGVIALVLLYIAVLVPAIEEIFKPIGVWLFAAKLDSPARGFTLGALSGAGYALIETVGVSGQQSADWAGLLASRVGTGLLHITTSALMGATIVLAWRERRYLRLLGIYLLAVLLHGSWNAFAMLFSFSSLSGLLDRPGDLSRLQPATLAAMGLLAAGLFALLLLANRRLRRAASRPAAEELDPGGPAH